MSGYTLVVLGEISNKLNKTHLYSNIPGSPLPPTLFRGKQHIVNRPKGRLHTMSGFTSKISYAKQHDVYVSEFF